MNRIARRAVISGRVQGVSFRAWTVDRARDLGLTGWVRNLPDGRVELHVEGPEAEVERLLAACREGPAAAQVEDLRVEPLDAPVARPDGAPVSDFHQV
jgi:acylphosphatase